MPSITSGQPLCQSGDLNSARGALGLGDEMSSPSCSGSLGSGASSDLGQGQNGFLPPQMIPSGLWDDRLGLL